MFYRNFFCQPTWMFSLVIATQAFHEIVGNVDNDCLYQRLGSHVVNNRRTPKMAGRLHLKRILPGFHGLKKEHRAPVGHPMQDNTEPWQCL